MGKTPTASHIRSRRRSPALPTRRWHSGTPAAPTRPACCGTDLGTRPLAKQIAQLARRARIALPGQPLRRYRGLTARELQVLRLVAVGRSNREISAELFICVKAASVHVPGIVG
jgi:ATP/maltotriose-dependent transcriptional regulator MalT